MKLLFAIAEMGVGGAETMVEDLAAAAIDDGDTITLVTTGGFRAERLVARGVGLHPAPMRDRRPADLARAVWIARRAVRRARPAGLPSPARSRLLTVEPGVIAASGRPVFAVGRKPGG